MKHMVHVDDACGYLYNAAEYGPAKWVTIDAATRQTWSMLGGPEIFQVGSPAIAERLCAILNTLSPAIVEDFKRRSRKDFLHVEIKRRGRIGALAVRALRAGEYTKAFDLRERYIKLDRQIKLQRALLDPNSPESIEREASRAALRARVTAYKESLNSVSQYG